MEVVMLKRILAVSVAITLVALCSPCLHAQGFGIQGNASVQAMIPPTTPAGGGPNCPPQVIVGNSGQPLVQSSFNLLPPLVCSGSEEAFDPSEDALYTASAAANVTFLGVNNGVLDLGLGSSGGTLDPNEINYVDGTASALIYWQDTLVFAGGGLPPDAPVLLQVTLLLQGSISANGQITTGLNEALYSNVDFGTNLPNLGLNCGTATVPAISQSYVYPASLTQLISVNPSYLVCVPAGAPVGLSNQLFGEIGGYQQWSGNVNVNLSGIGIKVLTPGVTYISYSGVTYPVQLSVPTSGSTCNGVYSGTFSGNLSISSGQNCTFMSGGITGNVEQHGGTLVLAGATVGGDVQINGGTFSIGPSVEIDGHLRVRNIPEGTTPNQICGTTVKGNLHVKNNGTAVQIGSCPGNVIEGNLQVEDNTAATWIYSNTVGGNLEDQNNTAATVIEGNTVGGNLQAEDNTVSTQILNNSVTNNLICQDDTSITGGGNTAKHKKGQCTAF
jgi:hypothetical protein